jgi:hypothetical protein
MLKDLDVLPRVTKLFLYLYGEKLELQVAESSIESVASKVQVKFGARRQPDFGVTLRKGHR